MGFPHSRIVNDLINNRAIDGVDPKEMGLNKWVEHWLKVAEEIKQEMLNEGLVNTANLIQEEIEYSKRLIKEDIELK
jgi:hypothetical protein